MCCVAVTFSCRIGFPNWRCKELPAPLARCHLCIRSAWLGYRAPGTRVGHCPFPVQTKMEFVYQWTVPISKPKFLKNAFWNGKKQTPFFFFHHKGCFHGYREESETPFRFLHCFLPFWICASSKNISSSGIVVLFLPCLPCSKYLCHFLKESDSVVVHSSFWPDDDGSYVFQLKSAQSQTAFVPRSVCVWEGWTNAGCLGITHHEVPVCS